MHRFLRMAKSFAETYNYDSSLEYLLCALIVKGGRVLSVGYNHRGLTALQNVHRVGRKAETVHAEVHAVLQKRDKIRFEGSKIFVVRLRADGSLGLARPCPTCQAVLKAYGIKKAYYSISNEEYGVLLL